MKSTLDFILFFIILLAVSVDAMATETPYPETLWRRTGCTNSTLCKQGTAASSCSVNGGSSCSNVTMVSATQGQCKTCAGSVFDTTYKNGANPCSGAANIWDDELNQCVEACTGGKIRDLTGTCVCPDGMTDNNGTCEIPACDGTINPVTGACDVYCPSGNYATVANATYGLEEGDCIPMDSECMADNATIVKDPTAQITAAPGSTLNNTVGCIPAPPLGCTNVTGKLKFNNFDYCQERANDCTSLGGTYGAIGEGGQTAHVCLKDYGTPLPTCASGSQFYFDDESASGFACVPTTPPVDQCDGQKFDCDNDGKVDDQDKDGCKDNGTTNEVGCVGSPGGTPGAPGPGEPGGPNVGEEPLEPPTEGEGDCDPTASNYAECAGLNSGELLEYLKKDGDSNMAPLDADSIGDVTNTLSENITNAPIVQVFGNLGDSFSGSGVCPAPSFAAFGETFTFDYHCTLYQSVAGILSSLMLVLWTITGIRHIASA